MRGEDECLASCEDVCLASGERRGRTKMSEHCMDSARSALEVGQAMGTRLNYSAPYEETGRWRRLSAGQSPVRPTSRSPPWPAHANPANPVAPPIQRFSRPFPVLVLCLASPIPIPSKCCPSPKPQLLSSHPRPPNPTIPSRPRRRFAQRYTCPTRNSTLTLEALARRCRGCRRLLPRPRRRPQLSKPTRPQKNLATAAQLSLSRLAIDQPPTRALAYPWHPGSTSSPDPAELQHPCLPIRQRQVAAALSAPRLARSPKHPPRHP